MTASQLALALDTPISGRVRRNDPRTSLEAGRACDAQRQKDVLQRELTAALHGRTCDELEAATGIPRYVVASRLAQMRRDNLVEPFGTRENAAGRNVQLWFALTQPRTRDVETGWRL